jgi:hypothetical protein
VKHAALLLGLAIGLSSTSAHADLGVMADVGAPDGANASLVYRPLGAVRLHAGVGHNMISTGGRIGVTLIPLQTWFTPTLSFDVGRYGDGDANKVAQQVSGDPMFSSSFLDKVGYSYANAHLGLELGKKTVTFYLNVGASRVDAELSGARAMASTDEDVTITIGQSHVVMWSVSARTGLILYFL